MARWKKQFRKSLKIMKWMVITVLVLPLSYCLISLILGLFTVNSKQDETNQTCSIYLHSNGVHLDLIIARNDLDEDLTQQISDPNDQYISFGWGEREFYLHTPRWSDLKFKTAVNALFLESPTLIHVYRHQAFKKDWIEIKVSTSQLKSVGSIIKNTFDFDNTRKVQVVKNASYADTDRFYISKGSYSAFNTCNTFVNSTLKRSGLKACY